MLAGMGWPEGAKEISRGPASLREPPPVTVEFSAAPWKGAGEDDNSLAVSMQSGEPLIPAFSPSEGEKEKVSGALVQLTIQ